MAKRKKGNRTTKRKSLSVEEKTARALQALFILQAAQVKMAGGPIRKILGIAMNEVTPILKVVNKTLKQSGSS